MEKYSLLVTSGRNITMLKTLAVVCLAAVAFGEPEAKADADPYLLYGGYGLGYSGYHYPYTGYAYGYYGKREADAEPKADADPYLLYGGYGLGLKEKRCLKFLKKRIGSHDLAKKKREEMQ